MQVGAVRGVAKRASELHRTEPPHHYYRTEDYHCVSVSHLFGSPLSRSIFVYEWPHLSVTLTFTRG